MFLKSTSLIFLSIGVFILMQVVLPLLSYTFWEFSSYNKNQFLVDPYPSGKPSSFAQNVLGLSVENIGNFPAFVINPKSPMVKPAYDEFKITVPKLNLKDIEVKVYSNDFEKNLAHLPGSVLPGEKGNVFITGHSSIIAPSAKSAFFANLHNMKKGDEIFVEALGQNFTYNVVGIKIVDPKETWVINPPDSSGRYLTLMTCVPPGFNTKRLVVLTKLK